MRDLAGWVCYRVYMGIPCRLALSMPGWFMSLVGDYAYHPSRFRP